MAAQDNLIGQRMEHWRRRQGYRQAYVASVAGITEDYYSKIARGEKVPKIEVLVNIARALGVSPGALLADDDPNPSTDRRQGALGPTPDITTSLLGPTPATSAVRHPAAALRDRVESAWSIWQTSPRRFTAAATLLPDLIVDVEYARRGGDPVERREAHRCAADLYGLLRSYCRRTGRGDLSLLVADRAIRAAEDADDPLRIAAAHWNLAHALLGNNAPQNAEQVALDAAGRMETMAPSSDTEALIGALHLVAVVAAARRRNWWAARERLAARPQAAAANVGDGNPYRTVFGPLNVRLHAVSIEMEAGEPAMALQVAGTIDTAALPLERQFTFALDTARCYDLQRDDAGALVTLLDIEQTAPEDLLRSPLARQIVTRLCNRSTRTYRRQITALADRLHIT